MSRELFVIDRCPLCGSNESREDLAPEPNLYSEKIAAILDIDESRLLREHTNWRCDSCGLIFKRHWFSPTTFRELFGTSVAVHPKGWDTVLGRFTPAEFERTLNQWADAIDRSAEPLIRRGERELLSLVDSIEDASEFDRSAVTEAIARRDQDFVRSVTPVVAAAITAPAPFKRFTGFRSTALWEYLQDKTGGFAEYAEVGCPLWGLLGTAVDKGAHSTFLQRDEPNYWGEGCVHSGERCVNRLLHEHRISTSPWTASDRYPVIGLFQYLDHLVDPGTFLRELFSKTESAAIILDGVDRPVAIQHMTGWTEMSLAYVAECFDKRLHNDFAEIRPSGNVLYLLAGKT